jgi:osomolarity two-component system response regulator SSK1
MDIQLPVMDGIEATKRIRAIEKKQKTGKIPRHAMTDEQLSAFRSPVIIVALTASSLASDREAALSVGCNDFLTKPVDLVWLEKKIIEWGCMQALIDFDSWRKWKRSEGVTEPKAIKAAAAAVLASKAPPSKNVVAEASSSSSSSTMPASPTPSKSSEAPSARKGVLLPGASGLKRRSSTAAEENSKNGGGSSRRPLTRSNSEPQIQVHEQQPPPPSSSNDSHFGTLSPIKEASGSSDGSIKLLNELATAEMQSQQEDASTQPMHS